MEYTVKQLGKLAGVSPRTLRYYDQIGLLEPARINSSGYRIYGRAQVERLQQILFYKELGVDLETIKQIITAPTFDVAGALHGHREELLKRRAQLDLLIENVDKSIGEKEGRIKMSDVDKFQGFKQKLVDENEQKYGKEVRAKYGDQAVEQSNQKVLNMTKEQHDACAGLAQEIIKTLHAAMAVGDPGGELGQMAADLHRQWLSHYWKEYNKEAHAGLAEMYVADQRFTAYYDGEQPGTAKFLRDAVLIYTGKK